MPIQQLETLARSHYMTSDGVVLPVKSWLPPSTDTKAIILAIHGFNDYSHAFDLPGRYLSEHGIGVYAYDQRGFGNAPGRGRWAGINKYIEDIKGVVRQLRAKHPKLPLFLLGESMGGALAIVAMSSSVPPDVNGVILSAPAVWSRETMPWYQTSLLSLANLTVPEMELTGDGLKVQASDNIEILKAMGRDPLIIKETRVNAIAGLVDLMDQAQNEASEIRVPVLLIYGGNDQIIPKKPISYMLKKMAHHQQTRISYIPDGYHLLLRDLNAAQSYKNIIGWVSTPQNPLPYGETSGDELAKRLQCQE